MVDSTLLQEGVEYIVIKNSVTLINFMKTCHISGSVLPAPVSRGGHLHRHLPVHVGRGHCALCR